MPIGYLETYALPARVIDVSGLHTAFTEAETIGSAGTAPEPLLEALSDTPLRTRRVLLPGASVDLEHYADFFRTTP